MAVSTRQSAHTPLSRLPTIRRIVLASDRISHAREHASLQRVCRPLGISRPQPLKQRFRPFGPLPRNFHACFRAKRSIGKSGGSSASIGWIRKNLRAARHRRFLVGTDPLARPIPKSAFLCARGRFGPAQTKRPAGARQPRSALCVPAGRPQRRVHGCTTSINGRRGGGCASGSASTSKVIPSTLPTALRNFRALRFACSIVSPINHDETDKRREPSPASTNTGQVARTTAIFGRFTDRQKLTNGARGYKTRFRR